MLKHDGVLKRHCQAALDEYLDGRPPADEEDVAKIGTALMEKGQYLSTSSRNSIEIESII